MSAFFRKAAPLGVLAACIGLLALYVRRHLPDFESLSSISPEYLFFIGCASLLTLAVNGLFLKALTIDFGIDLCFQEHFSISVMTTFGNIFLPMRGGAGFRAVYLKSKYDFGYADFISSLAGTYLISFNVTSQIALVGMAVLFLQTEALDYLVIAAFAAVLGFTSWGILFPPATLNRVPARWARERLNQILSGWHMIRKSRRTVLRLFLLTVLYVLLSGIINWLEFSAFQIKDASGNPIGLLQSLIFSCIGSLSLLVSITPAALGIRESLLMFTSQFLGISPAQALAVSLLDRTVGFLVVALLAGFASVALKKQLCLKKIPAASCERG